MNEEAQVPQESETKQRQKNLVFRNIADYISDRMDLRYNSVKMVTEYRRRGDDTFQIFADRERNGLYLEMAEDDLFKFRKEHYDLYIHSDRVPMFDPYKAYFEKLEWDGEHHIQRIADYIKVEDTPQYNFAWQLKKWLVRAVKCALEPNYFNKQILILVGGEQNTGKTTFMRWLCPPALEAYKSEESPSGKEESIQLSSNFLIFYDELVKLNKASEEEIKTILSKTVIKYRPPYARTEQNFPRRCSFIGTCNPTEFLTDPTGNVRFLAWKVKNIDFAYKTAIDINQVWAQAYYLYKGGFQCDMTKREIDLQAEYNQQFMVNTTEQDMIQQYLRPARENEPYGTTIYLWTAGQILQFLADNISNLKLNAVQLGKSLKLLGFKNKIVSINSYKRYVYPVVLNLSETYVSGILKRFYKKEKEEIY